MSAVKYFKDNSQRVNAQTDPVQHTQQQGLLAMAQQLDNLGHQNTVLLQQLAQMQALLQLLSRR